VAQRIAALVLAFVFAVLAGFGATVALSSKVGNPGPTASLTAASSSRTPGATAASSASAPAPATAAASEAAATAPSTPEPTAVPPPTTPTSGGFPVASVTFHHMQLDDPSNVAVGPRTFSFESDGPGLPVVKLLGLDGGPVRMCLRPVGGTPACHVISSAGPVIALTPKSSHTRWIATLIGTPGTTPTVDVSIEFPATNPALTLTHGRFDGTTWPNLNGVAFDLVARDAGDMKLEATWGGHPFDYALSVRDVTTAGPPKDLPGNGIGVRATVTLTQLDSFGVELHNNEAGFGTTDMTLKLSWP
jgi:hypothetical protein